MYIIYEKLISLFESVKDIPKGQYYNLDYDKSYCKNNSKIGDYDNVLVKVSF